MKIAKEVFAWLLALFLCFVFLKAGWSKFDPASGWTRAFHHWGFPDWFLITVGVLEVAAALLLLVPRTAMFGAAIIIVLMIGGAWTNVSHGDTRHVMSSVTPMILASIVFALRRHPLRYTATPPLASASSSRE
jgi:uncharacterized membrane protein YphA (DoxX/SURF4 family)